MIDLAYSKKMYKRAIYVFICCLMSALLCVTMFPTQAIAKAKENIAYAVLADTVGNIGVSENANNADQENNDDNQQDKSEESKNDINKAVESESAAIADNEQNEKDQQENQLDEASQDNNYSNDSSNVSQASYDENLNHTEFENQDNTYNTSDAISSYNANLLNEETQNNKEIVSSKENTSEYNKWNDNISNNSYNLSASEDASDDTTKKSVFNDPDWQFDSRTEGKEAGGKQQQWWKKEEEKKEQSIKDQEGGTGTEEDPFLVGTKETFLKLLQAGELKGSTENYNKHFKLIANIDLTDPDVAKKNDFEDAAKLFPYSLFCGVLDGNGYTISCSNNARTPLFWKLRDATIKGLTLKLSIRYVNAEESGTRDQNLLPNELGLLSSFCENSATISDCKFFGNVVNRDDESGWKSKRLGGVIGYASGKTTNKGIYFKDVKSEVTISCNGSARHYAGGFVGLSEDNIDISFENCKNQGSVTTLSGSSALLNMFIEIGKILTAYAFGIAIAKLLDKFYPGTAVEEELGAEAVEEYKNGVVDNNYDDKLTDEQRKNVASMHNEPDHEKFYKIKPAKNIYETQEPIPEKEVFTENINSQLSGDKIKANEIDTKQIKENVSNSNGFIQCSDIKKLEDLSYTKYQKIIEFFVFTNDNGDVINPETVLREGGTFVSSNVPIKVLSINDYARQVLGIPKYDFFDPKTPLDVNDYVFQKYISNKCFGIREGLGYYFATGKNITILEDLKYNIEVHETDWDGSIYGKISKESMKDIPLGGVCDKVNIASPKAGCLVDEDEIRKYLSERINEEIPDKFTNPLDRKTDISKIKFTEADVEEIINGVRESNDKLTRDILTSYAVSDDQRSEINLTQEAWRYSKKRLYYIGEDGKEYESFKVGNGYVDNVEYIIKHDPFMKETSEGTYKFRENKITQDVSHAVITTKKGPMSYANFATEYKRFKYWGLRLSTALTGGASKLTKALKWIGWSTIGIGTAVLSRLSTASDIFGPKSISPLMYLTSKACRNTFINTKNQSVGKLKMNDDVKEAIKIMIKQMQNTDVSSISDDDVKEAIKTANLDDDNVLYSDNIVNNSLYQIIGDFFIKRFNALTGNEMLYWNIFQDKNKDNSSEEIKHLEDTSDFTALQGRLISDGNYPVANLMSENDFVYFKSSLDAKNIMQDISWYKYNEPNKQKLYECYSNLGKAYCLACANANGGTKNEAYNQTIKFAMNAQNIMQDACWSLYSQERNAVEDYFNAKLNEHKKSHGAAYLRNFMNCNYSDPIDYQDFLINWAPKLENKFLQKAVDADIWEGDNADLDREKRTTILKHFFVTYLTYTGEFSYYNYLPLTRGVIKDKDSNMYDVDFQYSNEEIYSNNCANYVAGGETWKFTNKKPAIDFPIPSSVMQECDLYRDNETIESLFNLEYSKEDFIADINQQEESSDSGTSIGKISTGGGIYSSFESVSRALQDAASSIPRYDGSLFASHYRSSAGGFIGYCYDTKVSFMGCNNTGSIMGGQYAGGYIGAIEGSKHSSINVDSCFSGGSVIAADESHHDPTVGGYIGRVCDKEIEVNIKKSVSTGLMASRRTSAGFIGTAGGCINIENCGASGGIAAPRYCGGIVGITTDNSASINVNNCYCYCVFDGASNSDKTIDHVSFAFSLIGFYIPAFEVNGNRDKLNLNPPGALAGEWSSKLTVSNNFFYREGNDLIGRGESNKADNRLTEKCLGCSADKFASGCIAYQLNHAGEQTTSPDDVENNVFGQVIDDLSNNEKSNLPSPNLKMPVYKDLSSEQEIYTNFDPRYIKLYKVSFDYKNATLGPDVFDINVKKGNNFAFTVKANDSYHISKVWIQLPNDDNGAGLVKEELTAKSNDNYNTSSYFLESVNSNIIVHIETEENDLICPEGSGLDFDPYKITCKEELLWLNKTMKENMFTNVHVQLMKNIDMSGCEWSPVFSQREDMGFNGSFDGNGHSITNIKINSDGAESGAFFNGVEGGNSGGVFVSNKSYEENVKDFLEKTDKKIAVPADCYDLLYYVLSRFRGFDINNRLVQYFKDDTNKKTAEEVCLESLKTGQDNVGMAYLNFNQNLLGDDFKVVDSSGEHGVVKNLTLQGEFGDAVFAKSARDAKFENCIASGVVTGSGKVCGGLVAIATKNVQFKKCENRASISFNAADTYYPACGGIVGTLTSMKYVYADQSTTDKSKFTGGNNYLDAEITECKNYGSISAGTSFYKGESDLDVGGIVGNISEFDKEYSNSKDVDYKELDDDEENASDGKKTAVKLQAAYVLIDSCENYGSIGDTENTYSSRNAGIIASVGYLHSKQNYKCLTCGCANYGEIGFDTGGYEAGVKKAAGICAYANSSHYDVVFKNYQLDNSFIPITKNLESIQHSESKIYNCANYGLVRSIDARDISENKYSGEILGMAGLNGVSVNNCLTSSKTSSILGYMTNSAKLSNIYCHNDLKLPEEYNNDQIIRYSDDDLISGKTTYDLMNVDLATVDNIEPKFGQNIDITQINGHKYERQFVPCLLDDNTQKVYKKDAGDSYSMYSGNQKIYTNIQTDNPDWTKENSYKVNIKVEDENGITDSKDICVINGYVKVKKDDFGNANFEYNIYGKKGYNLLELSFGGNNIQINDSAVYSFKLAQRDNKLLLSNNGNNELKSYVDNGDGYTCFDLVAKFGKEKKPVFKDSYYNITNILELKWYANHFNDADVCKQDAESKTGVWNALIANDIIIEDDDDVESIGTINNKFTGKLTGSLNGTGIRHIVNKSSKPIFGVLGSNAEVSNLRITSNYTASKEDDLKWTAALADKAIGENIKIEKVYIDGSVGSDPVKDKLGIGYKTAEDVSAAAFISKIEPDTSENENSGKPSSVYINNSISQLSIRLHSTNIGGFVGTSSNSRVHLSNCINAATTLTNYCFDYCNIGGAIARVYDNVDNQEYFGGNPNIKIDTFSNSCEISSTQPLGNINNSKQRQFGCGGVVGTYKVYSELNLKNTNSTEGLQLIRCTNNSQIRGYSNTGGLVGNCRYADDAMCKESSEYSNLGKLKLISCENDSICISSIGIAAGGLLGSVCGSFAIDLSKCLSSASLQRGHKSNDAYLGGLIGYTNTKANIDINTVSARMDIPSALLMSDKNVAYLIGGYKNFNSDNLYYTNTYYMINNSENNFKFNAIYNPSFNDDSMAYSQEDYKSGKVAHLLDKNCEIENDLPILGDADEEKFEKPWTIGQMLDKNTCMREEYPHLNSLKVYNPSDDIYTNFDEKELSERYIIHVHPSENSTWKGIDAYYEFKEKDKEWNLNFGDKLDKYILSKLVINGKRIENNENNADYSFYKIWKSNDTMFNYGLINLKNLNSSINNPLHTGFNDFEYSFDLNREPAKTNVSVKDNNMDAYAITCAHEFMWVVSNMENNLVKYRYISLENDIDLSLMTWNQAIDWKDYRLLGNNHKIFNISGEAESFIKDASNAYFSNLEIDVNLKTTSAKSAFIANTYSNVIIDGVTVTGSVESTGICETFGGIVGTNHYGLNYRDLVSRKDDQISDLLNFAPQDEEGFDLINQSGNVVRNCNNRLKNISWGSYNEGSICAGLVGKVESVSDVNYAGLYIKDCDNYSNIKSIDSSDYSNKVVIKSVAAGIVGYGRKSANKISIYNCKNYGSIYGFFAGGILGLSGRNSDNNYNIGKYINIKSCDNSGNVTGKICGGILASSFSSAVDKSNKCSTIAIDSCINRGNLFCPKANYDTAHGFSDWNRAGGIIGLITDDEGDGNIAKNKYSDFFTSIVNINHCGNAGVINSNSQTPAGGIVGDDSLCKDLRIANSYSVDTVYNDSRWSAGCHSILGWKCSFVNGGTTFAFTYLDNVYEVGSNHIGTYFTGNNDYPLDSSSNIVWSTDSYIIPYSYMFSGALCYYLNERNHVVDKSQTRTQEYWNWSHLEDKRYLFTGPAFGQSVDNLKNTSNCSKMYPEPNHYNDLTVYKVGSSCKINSQNNNLNFASFANSNVFDECYATLNENSSHNQLFSNYKTSDNNIQNGVHVNVWHKEYKDGKIQEKQASDYHAAGQILTYTSTGDIVEDTDWLLNNGNCSKSLGNDYSCFYSRDNGIDQYRDYTIVCKPASGYMISWISVDGVIRNKEDYNYSGHIGRYNCDYNIIKTSSLSHDCSHTIDVGFAKSVEPKNLNGFYQITNYPELLWFQENVSNGNIKDQRAELVNDIVASFSSKENLWNPIGSDDHPFNGTFKGNGHKIVGLIKSDDYNNVGFFGRAKNATISNLILESFDFTATGKDGDNKDERTVGGLIAVAENVNVSDVHVKGIIQSAGNRMGGLIGYIGSGSNKIERCTSTVQSNAAVCTTGHVGGIVGYIDNSTNTTIDKCSNFSSLKSNTYPTGASSFRTDYAGGIVGFCDSHNKTILNITNCFNRGTILGDSSGGMIGDFRDDSYSSSSSGAKLRIQGCSNYGNVCGDYCGGIIGRISRAVKGSDWYSIDWCNNFGSIGTANYRIKNAGGIIGEVDDTDLKIDLNYDQNFGTICTGGGFSTGISQHRQAADETGVEVTGIGMSFFVGFITGSLFTGPQAALIVSAAFTVYYLAEFLVRTIMTFTVELRSSISPDAGGIIGNVSDIKTMNMSNIINYGTTSSAKRSNGIVSHFSGSDLDKVQNINNVYSVKSFTSSDNSGNKDSRKFNYYDFKDFKNGTVANKIESESKAGLSFIDGKSKDDTKVGVNSVNTKESKVIKRINGYKDVTYYFGQNLDLYGDEKGISAIPNYMYSSARYTVWESPKDMTDLDDKTPEQRAQILAGRQFFTNFRNLASITSRDFGHFKLNGEYVPWKEPNEPSFLEDNDSLQSADVNSGSKENASAENNEDSSHLASYQTDDFDENSEIAYASENDEDNKSDDGEDSQKDESDEESNEDTSEFNINLSDTSNIGKLKDYFDFVVTGGSSIGNIPSMYDVDKDESKNTDTKFLKDFQMFHKESIKAKITPKQAGKNTYTILSVEMPFSDESGTKYFKSVGDKWIQIDDPTMVSNEDGYMRIDYEKQIIVHDDGVIEDVYNPRYLFTNNNPNGILVGCHYKVYYFPDGGVEVNVYDGIESKTDFDVKITVSKVPPHIHKVPDTGKEWLFRSWDGKSSGQGSNNDSDSETDSMPVNPGAYYLTKDIEIDKTWVVPDGKIYLCLNGHSIKLKNGAYIDVASNNANLQICDCKHGQDGAFWKYNEDSNSNLTLWRTKDVKDDRVVNAGIIYSSVENSNDVSEKMFEVGPNSTLRIDNINVFQHAKTQSVVNIKNNITENKYNVTLNANFFESKNVKSNEYNKIVSFAHDQANLNYEKVITSSLIFGDKYSHLSTDKYKDNTNSDVYSLCSNTSLNIDFFDNYKFENAIVIDVDIPKDYKDACINLTTNFDKFIEKGIVYNKAFKLKRENNNVVALTSLEDIKMHENLQGVDFGTSTDNEKVYKEPELTYNNICVCHKEFAQDIVFDIEGPGSIYPNVASSDENEVIKLSYKKGSKAKFTYFSNELTFLNQFIIDKTALSSFTAKTDKEEAKKEYSADSVLYTSQNVDKNLNGKGSFIIDCLDKLEQDKQYFDKETQERVVPDSDVECSTKFYADFNCTKDVDINNGHWNLWRSTEALPDTTDIINAEYDGGYVNYNNIHYFRLCNSVYLHGQWAVPDTKIVVDLNGFEITYDSRYESISRDNLVLVNNKQSLLTICDSSLVRNDATIRNFKKNSDGKWDSVATVTEEDKDIVSIKGGLIHGGHVTTRNWHKYDDYAGAILVKRGVLNFISGNLSLNTSEGCLGGSAITVNEKASCYIYSEATVSNNELSGDSEYQQSLFASGVASEGYLYNEGKIINNTANNCAASAVAIHNSTFDNSGEISGNKTHLLTKDDRPDKYTNPFGTIYIDRDSQFKNTGLITNNTSDFRVAAVRCSGSLILGGKNKIYNNYWTSEEKEDDKEEKVENKHQLDIANSNEIQIDGRLEYEEGCQSVLSRKTAGTIITKDWELATSNNMGITADRVFKVEKDESDNDKDANSLVLAVGNNQHNNKNEVKVVSDAKICKVESLFFMEGQKERLSGIPNFCNLNFEEKYVCGEDINIIISPSDTLKVTAIKIADEDIDVTPEHINRFVYNFKGWGDQKDAHGICTLPMMITLKDYDAKMEAQKKKEYDAKFTPLKDSDRLPEFNGCYKLERDIVLNSAWHPASGKTVLDLNGYSITINKENENVIYVDKSDTDLEITDSSLLNGYSKFHYLVKGDKGYKILQDASNVNDKAADTVTIKGGFIGNAHFSNTDTTSNSSGAVFIEKGSFYLEAGSIVANSVNNIWEVGDKSSKVGQGSSAIFIGREAKAKLGDENNGDKVNISYNYSTCIYKDNIDYPYSYGAAGAEIRGVCTNYATISNNEADWNSVAGAAVITQGSTFYNKGKIINNVAKNYSVAGLLVCSDGDNTESKDNSGTSQVCYASNSGEISGNIAEYHSVAAVELYGRFENTGEGKVVKNRAIKEDSFAGIYSCGDLLLDQSSQICQNISIANNAAEKYQDIVFDENNYNDYTVKNGHNPDYALFTIGPNFNPSISTYRNGKDDGAKPYSLTHVAVNNYEAKSGNTLLLAKNFISSDPKHIRTMQDINSYFEVMDNNFDISATGDGCIYYGYSKDNSYLHVSSNDGGTVTCLGDTVTPKSVPTNIQVEATPIPGYHIESVVLNSTTYLPVPNNKKFVYTYNNQDEKIVSNGMAAIDVKFAQDYASIERVTTPTNWTNWSYNTTLPSSAGCYRLTTDVYLASTWCVPKVYPLILDLNGHNITVNSNQPILRLNERDTSLDIIDTCADNKVKCKFKKDDSGKYIKSDDGNISYTTGCLYGGSAYDGGCIYVSENTYMSVKNINIVGNEAVENGGAVYNNGNFVLGKNASIVGNVSQTGAAIYNSENAVLQVDGIIKNNVATKNAAGIFANGIFQMCDNAIIGNNVILKLDKNKKVTNAIEAKATYSDVVFKEYSDKDSKGSIIKIFPPSNSLKNEFNNDNMCLYASCMRHDSEEIMYTIQLPLDPNMFMPDPGLYVPTADGFHDFIYDETANKYVPSKNPSFKAENKPLY